MQHAAIDRTDHLNRNEDKYSPRATVAILAGLAVASWGVIVAGVSVFL